MFHTHLCWYARDLAIVAVPTSTLIYTLTKDMANPAFPQQASWFYSCVQNKYNVKLLLMMVMCASSKEEELGLFTTMSIMMIVMKTVKLSIINNVNSSSKSSMG